MRSSRDLVRIVERIDGRGYRAYKELRGSYSFGDHELWIDHVQGDPYAAPSKLRVRVPTDVAAWPQALLTGAVRRTALADLLARKVRHRLGRPGGEEGSGRSGIVTVDAGGQEVLERTAVRIDSQVVELRLEAGLPARGRRILGSAARRLLTETIPDAAMTGLCREHRGEHEAQRFVEGVENQEHLRARLGDLGLVAFVADGSRLPRESGASDRPLPPDRTVPFESPESLRVRIEVPNPTAEGQREVSGMGIPVGVTLIVGGGYHGKSTLLRAIERGVYPHVPGDGRELVVSDPALVKIRAEDGRRVERVDIRGFIDPLPSGTDTRAFSSDDASGSTSQAASIVEAMEAGASGLLLDEDTSATNFLVRDARMQSLVRAEEEPITPFVDRVRELYEQRHVSTLLVMGGSGDYFDVADLVIGMRDYRPSDLTARARAIASQQSTGRRTEAQGALPEPRDRVLDAASFDPARGRRNVRISAPDVDRIEFGRDTIDLRAVEQIVDRSQTRAIALAIHLASRRFVRDGVTLPAVLDALERTLDEEGLDVLDPFQETRRTGEHPGNLARPRRLEVAAAINRLRSLRVQ